MRLVVAAAVLAAMSATAMAAEDARWYLQVDNDVLFTTDRWYSSGARIARVAADSDGAHEWGVLHEVFTPEARDFVRGMEDRAPTARLLAVYARHRRLDAGWFTGSVMLGVRGLGAQGERVTDNVHHIISAPSVDWSREVHSRLDASVAATASPAWGPFMAHVGGVLGSELAFGHAGFQASFGPAPLLSQPLRYVATPPFDVGDGGKRGWGLVMGASVRGVARNRMLDLGYDPEARPPDRRRVVTRVAIGASLLHRWGDVSLTAVQESREFTQQRQAQRFGVLGMHIPF